MAVKAKPMPAWEDLGFMTELDFTYKYAEMHTDRHRTALIEAGTTLRCGEANIVAHCHASTGRRADMMID